MTEIPQGPDPLSLEVAAGAARALMGIRPSPPKEITFRPLYADHEEEAQFMGEALHRDALAMMRRYPASHAPNLAQVLNATRAGHEPATLKDWLQGTIRLTNEEVVRLGERHLSDSVLSVVRIPREDIAKLATIEPDRQKLAEWLVEAADDPLLGQLDIIELRLFNDATELAVGESSGTGDQTPSRWVIRSKQYSDENFVKLQDRLARLGDLVPATHIIRKGERSLALTEWSLGGHVGARECNEFIDLVRARGIDPNDFDIHGENIVGRPDGRLVYVDGDFLYVK